MTFSAGQKVRASALNAAIAQAPQIISSTRLTASASSISISIPSGYNHLQCVWAGRQDAGTTGGGFAKMQLNADTAAHYAWQQQYGSGATSSSANAGALDSSIHIGVIPLAGDTASFVGGGEFTVHNIASTSMYKAVSGRFGGLVSATGGYAGTIAGTWESTAAVTSLTLLPNSGNWIAETYVTVYGWA